MASGSIPPSTGGSGCPMAIDSRICHQMGPHPTCTFTTLRLGGAGWRLPGCGGGVPSPTLGTWAHATTRGTASVSVIGTVSLAPMPIGVGQGGRTGVGDTGTVSVGSMAILVAVITAAAVTTVAVAVIAVEAGIVNRPMS